MRLLDLFAFGQDNDFVESLNSGSPASIADFTVGDSLLLAVRKVVLADTGSATVFKEVAWDSLDMRASVGLLASGPDGGKFKLKVGDQETADITWPATFADAAAVTTFKANVLAAIIALSNVAPGAIANSDPTGTPAHLLYFTWTDPADVREISVVGNALVPLCIPEVSAQRPAPGYQQVVRLVQAPVKETIDFALVDQTQPTVVEKQAGQAGRNEIQRLTIAEKSIGSISLQWNGASTRSMAVPGVTAEQIAAALNAIVVSGDTDPSFSVLLVQGAGATYDIEFIGPLKAAAQDDLGAVLLPSVPATVATATLDLAHPRFVRILNGAKKATLQFEFVYTDNTGREATIIRDVVLKQDMTNNATVAALEDADAVIIRDRVVNVPADGQVPYAGVAPGSSFSPAAELPVGTSLDVTLPFVTRNPFGAVFYKDPERADHWRQMQRPGEFDYESISDTHVLLWFTQEITDTGDADAVRDKSRFKVYFAAPDAIVQIFGDLAFTWDQVRQSLPAGKTVTAKFAELEAMIATLAGGLIIGPESIDVDALIRRIVALLKSDPTLKAIFIDLIKTVITDREIIRAIINTIETDTTLLTEFIELLKRTFENTELIKKLIEELFKSATFLEEFRKLVILAFQSGATLPAGLQPLVFDDFYFEAPQIHVSPGPSAKVVTGTQDVTTDSGGTSTTSGGTVKTSGGTVTKTTVPTTSTVAGKLKSFEFLPRAIVNPTVGATCAGTLRLANFTEGQIRTATAQVETPGVGSRKSGKFPAGTILGRANGIVFPGRVEEGEGDDPDVFWPTEMESEMFPVQFNPTSLHLDSRFYLGGIWQRQLLGNVQGSIEFVVELGTISKETDDAPEINLFTWEEVMTVRMPLTEAQALMSVAIDITREESVAVGNFDPDDVDAGANTIGIEGHGQANGAKARFDTTDALPAPLVAGTDYFLRDVTTNTFKVALTLGGAAINITDAGTGTHSMDARDVRTGMVTLHGVTEYPFEVPDFDFSLRCALRRFDTQNRAGAKGAFVARIKSPSCSIAQI